MAPGNLFGRLMQYLANEVVVKTLANSPTFQRFAVRSSQQMKDFSKNAAATARTIADNPSLNEARKEAAQVTQDISQRAKEFSAALRNEISRGRRS